MEHRAPVDMLRFYGGDIRERTDDGKVAFGKSSKDTLWGDNEALGGPDFVSEKTLTIEGSILCDMQRYIYHEQYEMDKVELNKEKSSKVLSDKVVSDFKDFLDKHIPNNTKERGK